MQDRRRQLDALAKLNGERLAQTGDPEIQTRIQQYELAFRMQASVPELMNIRDENAETLELYGADPEKASFAKNCILARRLVERGVRMVELMMPTGTIMAVSRIGCPPNAKKPISRSQHSSKI